MPTYEYRCQKCNRTFETFQSMKDQPLAVCPQNLCQQEVWGHGKVKRLIGTGAGLIFKGSGFYTTDYRSSNYKESAKKEGESSKEAAKGGADKVKEGASSSPAEGVKSESAKSDGAKAAAADKTTGSSGPAPSKES